MMKKSSQILQHAHVSTATVASLGALLELLFMLKSEERCPETLLDHSFSRNCFRCPYAAMFESLGHYLGEPETDTKKVQFLMFSDEF